MHAAGVALEDMKYFNYERKGYNVKKCPHPKDQAKIARNYKAYREKNPKKQSWDSNVKEPDEEQEPEQEQEQEKEEEQEQEPPPPPPIAANADTITFS